MRKIIVRTNENDQRPNMKTQYSAKVNEAAIILENGNRINQQ